MDDLARTLLWLCEIPSPTGGEAELCNAVVERVSRARLAGDIRRLGDSLVVPLVRGTGGPRVVLAGHLDVVASDSDGPPRIDGDRLYGRGASDMKGGLALMLELAQRTRYPAVDLTLVFYAREEGPFADNELGPLLERDPELAQAEIAVCLEPTDNRLQLGCAGSIHATVRFRGARAHSARPWQGVNAIHKAAPFLTRLAALAPRRTAVDGLEWTTVTSATVAHGGRARNVIPDELELNVNHRFGPAQSLEQARAYLHDLVAGEAELVFAEAAPAARPCRDHPLVQAFAASVGSPPEAKQAWTDVARFAALGIPAVNFGPGSGAQAHQHNEWASLSLLQDGRDVLSRWLEAIAR